MSDITSKIDNDGANPAVILGSTQDPPVVIAKETVTYVGNTDKADSFKEGNTKRKPDDDINYETSKKAKQNSPKSKSLVDEKNGIPTHNPFELLNNDVNLSSLSSRENARINKETFQRQPKTSGTTKKQEKCPPIIITHLFADPKSAINALQHDLKGKAFFKIQRNGYDVQTECASDYDFIKQKLVELKIPFYTFTSKENKATKFVLKGIHSSYTPEEIRAELQAYDIQVLNVQPMYSKGKNQLNMFIVCFTSGTKIEDVKNKARYICNQKVTWQPFVKKSIGTQCWKCQLFGHAASNCGMNYRCVKCTHDHGPGNCPLEDNQPATCVNCNQNHPASYRKCPKYVEYLSRIQKTKGNQNGRRGNVNFKTRHSDTEFPKIASFGNASNVNDEVPNMTYSQVVQRETVEEGTSLSFLSDEISKLFRCDISMLILKIRDFVPAYKSQRDPTLKQIMIIDFLAQFV